MISFIYKIFGGSKEDKKKPTASAPPPQSEADKIAEKKIKIEAALNDLDIKIKNFEEKQKKFDYQIEILKHQVKKLIAADKKNDAKKYMEEATIIRKQAESYTLQKKVLADKKFQLEQAIMDMETIDALDTVSDHPKEQEKYSENPQDIPLDGEEAKMRQKQIDDKMRDMFGGESDEEEVDDMFNESSNDSKKDKEQLVPKGKNANVNITPPPQSEAEKIAEQKINIEAELNDLDIKIKNFEEQQKKLYYESETLMDKADELIAADKKNDAKKYMEEATMVRKQAQSYTLQKKVLVDKKFQLDQAIFDMETIDALDFVSDHLKEQEKYSYKLQDIPLDGEEAKMRQKQIGEQMRDRVQNESDEEEVDDMFNESPNDSRKDKEQLVSKGKNANVNITAPQTNKNVAKQEVDDVEDMLANL